MARKATNEIFDYKILQQNLNLIIAELGMSKTEFCKYLGLTSRTSVAKRFQGKGWKLEEMAKCSALAGKSVDEIFFSKLSTKVDK